MNNTSTIEKAKDLLIQFGLHVEIHKWNGKNQDHADEYSYDEKLSKENAKACAIILVDEIMSFIKEKFIPNADAISYMHDPDYLYYESVKEQILQI